MKKEIINTLTFLSYEGYQKTMFVESEDICSIKIDCADIKTEEDCYEIFGDYFAFPRPVKNWDAFSDWMRDLDFFNRDKTIRLELMNYDKGFEKDSELQYLFLSIFIKEILPYWEKYVTRVTSGYAQPRQFDVYCIMAQRIY